MMNLKDFQPGQTVIITHPAQYSREYRRGGTLNHYGEAQLVLRVPPPTTTKVLAVTPDFLICEGLISQAQMHQSVQDACKEAGLDPAVTIQLGYYTEVAHASPDLALDPSPSMDFDFAPLVDLSPSMRPPMKFIFDTPRDLRPMKFIFDTEPDGTKKG